MTCPKGHRNTFGERPCEECSGLTQQVPEERSRQLVPEAPESWSVPYTREGTRRDAGAAIGDFFEDEWLKTMAAVLAGVVAVAVIMVVINDDARRGIFGPSGTATVEASAATSDGSPSGTAERAKPRPTRTTSAASKCRAEVRRTVRGLPPDLQSDPAEVADVLCAPGSPYLDDFR